MDKQGFGGPSEDGERTAWYERQIDWDAVGDRQESADYEEDIDWDAVEEKVDEIINEYDGDSGALIEVLHEVQELVGYLPQRVQVRVADRLGLSVSEVYSVVTFYSLFSLKPKGENHITVCKGTACYVRGAAQLIEELENQLGISVGDTTSDGKFSLEVVRCLGACGLGPVAMVNNEDVFARITVDQVSDMLQQYED